MSTPAQTDVPRTSLIREPRKRARKRRKTKHEKESIFTAPEIKPYPLAIKTAGPTWATESPAAIGTTQEIMDIVPEPASTGREAVAAGNQIEEDTGKEKDQGKDERYRARALKAWETKRQRQKERFGALGVSNISLLAGQASTVPRALSDFSALDPLLDFDYRDLPDDIPKDGMLQSLQDYSSRYYTINGILLKPHKRKRYPPGSTHKSVIPPTQESTEPQGTRSVSSDHDTQPTSSRRADIILSIPAEDSGSGYGGGEGSIRPTEREDTDDEIDADPEEEQEEVSGQQAGPGKRGGPRGKRKLKDMYLSMDGSALLALGVLIQEQIITRLRHEGYVPASALEEDDSADNEEEGEPSQTNNAFVLSDDESQEESEDDI